MRINQDTVSLLKECNSGIKMGTSAIDEVLPFVKDAQLKSILNASKDEHAELGNETHELLLQCHQTPQEAHPIVSTMSKMKIKGKMLVNSSEASIAGVMIDGCNMGMKSLHKYLNRYRHADRKSRDVTERLITMEEGLYQQLNTYL